MQGKRLDNKHPLDVFRRKRKMNVTQFCDWLGISPCLFLQIKRKEGPFRYTSIKLIADKTGLPMEKIGVTAEAVDFDTIAKKYNKENPFKREIVEAVMVSYLNSVDNRIMKGQMNEGLKRTHQS